MLESSRRIIVHRHLFKNAGTTFDHSLKSNFGDNFIDHRDDEPMLKVGLPYLLEFINQNSNIKAISSHHVWFNMNSNNNIELIPVLLLRHPIERINSVYKFEKIQQSNSLGAQMAKKLSFQEYVKWRMQDNVPTTIRNYQCRHLAGIKSIKPVSPYQFSNALNQLNKLTFVGIVDLFEKSMQYFEKEFTKLNIEVNLTNYNVQNVNQKIEFDLQERNDNILHELGPLKNEVLDKNQYDIELYLKAKQNLLNKIR